MTDRSTRDSNRAHLRVEQYFVDELGWSSVGANRVQSLDDPIGTEPNRIGGVYVDSTDGHYAVLVRAVPTFSSTGERACPEDHARVSPIGTDTWFAHRLDGDAGVHAPHMREAGYWRLGAEVDSANRVAIRALNADGTLGPSWIPPLAVADDEVTTVSPMLTMTRREVKPRPKWWQRVPMGARVAVVITVGVAALIGVWYNGQRSTDPAAVVTQDVTPKPTPTIASEQGAEPIDAEGAMGDEGAAPRAATKLEIPPSGASDGSAEASDKPAAKADPTAPPGSSRAEVSETPAKAQPEPTTPPAETTSAAPEQATAAPSAPSPETPANAVPPQQTPEPPPTEPPAPAADSEAPAASAYACQGDGYSLTVPDGWSHRGCTVFDPGSAVADCACQHHIDVATASAETFNEAIHRIMQSSDYTVSTQSSTSVSGRAAQRFELIAHTASGDVGQTVVVIDGPAKVIYAAASQQADAGAPKTWSETMAAFDSIVGSLAFG